MLRALDVPAELVVEGNLAAQMEGPVFVSCAKCRADV